MRKYLFPVILLALLSAASLPRTKQVEAAALKFDKTTINTTAGQTFDLQVRVDAGTEQITSVDAYILFPNNLLQPQTVSPGTFFPTVTNNIQATKVYIAGLVDDPATSKSGVGTVATITFKALADGTATISYDCREGATDSSKVIKNDINATNIIVCSQNDTSTVTIGTGGGSTIAPTATPQGGGTTGGGTTGGGSTLPSQLPQTGAFDTIVKVTLPGLALLIVGGALRLLL